MPSVGTAPCRSGIAAALAAVLVLGRAAAAQPADPRAYLRVSEPPAKMTGRAPRVALIVTPSPATAGPAWAAAHGEMRDIVEAFTRLGFRVVQVGPANRVELVGAMRSAVEAVPLGAEVVIVARGVALAADRDIFLQPADAATVAGTARPLETDAVRLSDLARRVAARAPAALVALVNECHGRERAGTCQADMPADLPVTLMVLVPRAPAAGRPASAQPRMIAAMRTEGATLAEFGAALQAGLAASEPELRTGTMRHPGFAFMPRGFHALLDHPCNRVNRDADAVAARELRGQPLVAACEEANRLWPSPHFQQQMAALREQIAFRQAVTSCRDQLAAASYRSAYPAGRYLPAVEAFRASCDRTAEDDRREAAAREEQRREQQRRRQEELARARDTERTAPGGASETPRAEADTRSPAPFRFTYNARNGQVQYSDGAGHEGSCRIRAWGNIRAVRARLSRGGRILVAYETEPHGTAMREVPLRQICN